MIKSSKTDLLLDAVAEVYGISLTTILSRSRIAKIAEARQVTAYLLRELYNLSFPQIGGIVGGRDHSTIIHAYQKISSEVTKKPSLRLAVDSILKLTNALPIKNKEIPVSDKKGEDQIISKIETSDDILKYFQSIELTEREKMILGEYRQGFILEKMAKHFGLSRQRVLQIINKSLLKELGALAQQGYKINVDEYLVAEKKAHESKKGKIPEEVRKDILGDISNLSDTKSIKELSNKYSIPTNKLKEEFPELKTFIEQSTLDRQRRWSRFYLQCRRCKTDQISHKMWGYCMNCYYKTENFKEIQRRSFEKHIDKRRAKNREYSNKYKMRPEIISRMHIKNDLKFYDGNREKSIEYNNFKCTECGIKRDTSIQKWGKDFHVMHRDNNPENNSLNNLKPVCSNCFYKLLRGRTLQSKNANRLQSKLSMSQSRS